MRIGLTVIDGPALVWNGTPVGVPAARRAWLDALKPGTTLEAECRYEKSGLQLDDSVDPRVLTRPDVRAGTDIGVLVERGQFESALRLIEQRPADASTLAFKARALLERHRDVERRTTEAEEADLEAGEAALKEALALGGPDVPLDAQNSPWACWKALTHNERSPLSFELAVPLLKWVWRAIPRTSPDRLADFSPFMRLLNETPPSAWPAAPWLAWGLTPQHLLQDTFAIRAGVRLLEDEPARERAALERLLDDLRQRKKPPGGRRGGLGLRGLLSGLHVAAHSKRPKPLVNVALSAANGLDGERRRRWFEVFNEALAVAAVESELVSVKKAPRGRIERVLFRAMGDPYGVSPSISQLDNGRLLAVVPHARRRTVMLEADADEAVASMPEQFFPIAVVAVKEALS